MHSWRETVRDTSLIWLIFVAVLQVPLALLSGIDDYLLYMTPAELFHAVGFLLLVDAVAIVGVSLIAVVVARLLAMPGIVRADGARRGLVRLSVAVFLVVTAYWLLHVLQLWLASVLNLEQFGPDRALLAILASLICVPALLSIFGSARGLERWRARILSMRAPALTILVVGVLGVLTGDLSIYRYGQLAVRERPHAAIQRPNVFLITIDTLSAEDMSLYGYPIETTANLERFAQSAHVFERFFAASNFTTPAIVSLMTGRQVDTHRIMHLEARLAPDAQKDNVAQVLHDAGYLTAAFVANPYAHPLQSGMAASFDYVAFPPRRGAWGAMLARLLRLEGFNLQPLVDRLLPWLEPVLSHINPEPGDITPFPAEHVFAQARAFLDRYGAQPPLFVWVHIMPPHDPYLPPAPFLYSILPGKTLDTRASMDGMAAKPPKMPQAMLDQMRLRYDEHVRYADDATGHFLDELKARGYFDSSVVLVAADHGESFGRGWVGHNGPYLYQSLIHVPLIVRLPGQTQGSRIGAFAQHADVAPTLLELLGLPRAGSMEGESLLPALSGRPLAGMPKFSMNLENDSRFGDLTSGTVAVMADGHKYIRYLGGRRNSELYDLNSDPHEGRDLVASSPALVEKFEAIVRARRADASRRR